MVGDPDRFAFSKLPWCGCAKPEHRLLEAFPPERGILLGEGGSRMKAIASQARADMEQLFGGRVFLDVWVRVKPGWADSDAMLKRLGY